MEVFSEDELKRINEDHQKMSNKIDSIILFFDDWKLKNNGEIYFQIECFVENIKEYLCQIEVLFKREMVYISCFKHTHKDFRKYFENDHEMVRHWCRNNIDSVVLTFYKIFFKFSNELSYWGIKHNSLIWRCEIIDSKHYDETIKECFNFDPVNMLKLKSIISLTLKLMKDCHLDFMDRYKSFSEHGIVPIGEEGFDHWEYRELEKPLYHQ